MTIIANAEWLGENPALERLSDLIEISLLDIAAQNARIIGDEDDLTDIIRHADE